MNEKEALIVLNAVPGLGNRTIHKLVTFFRSAGNVLRATGSELKECRGIKGSVLKTLRSFPKDRFLKSETARCREQGITIFTQADSLYPQKLREISDAPVLLYAKGNVGLLARDSVAVIGSRRATMYGIATAERFSSEFSQRGLTVVSGMARGIDAAAHRGALKASGGTVAVLGTGLNQCYPLENERLMESILDQDGLILSEFPLDFPPRQFNFPRRNRIISGLSLGVVVVEATQKSGALITADFALEQGREVFAVPGPVHSPASFGTNRLIQQGAKCVMAIEDILEEIQTSSGVVNVGETGSPRKPEQLTDLDSEEEILINAFDNKPLHLDTLNRGFSNKVNSVSKTLLSLQLKGRVQQLPGNFYSRSKEAVSSW